MSRRISDFSSCKGGFDSNADYYNTALRKADHQNRTE